MFPVEKTGTYTIYLSEKDLVDAVVHRNGTDTTKTVAGTPPAACSSDIQGVWESTLDYDGEGCDIFVPYMIRFPAVAGGQNLKLLVLHTS